MKGGNSAIRLWLVFLGGLMLFGISAFMLSGYLRDDVVARSEYDYLRGIMPHAPVQYVVANRFGFTDYMLPQTSDGVLLPQTSDGVLLPQTSDGVLLPQVSDGVLLPQTSDGVLLPQEGSFAHLFEINPDVAGWIYIPGTSINYPIVQGYNNDFYISHTFKRTPNPAGAIFLDYRAYGGFGAAVSILYGHNMRNGSMFAPLLHMQPHTHITIRTTHETISYEVFEIRRTNAWDYVYRLDFSDADGAADFFGRKYGGRFLVLSTCIGHTGSDARLVVFAQELGGN